MDEGTVAFPFGVAFLVPAECAYDELGEHRRALILTSSICSSTNTD